MAKKNDRCFSFWCGHMIVKVPASWPRRTVSPLVRAYFSAARKNTAIVLRKSRRGRFFFILIAV